MPIQGVMIRGRGRGREGEEGEEGEEEEGEEEGEGVLIITPWMGSGAFLV